MVIDGFKFTDKVESDDLSARPSFLQSEGKAPVELMRFFIWAMFFLEGEDEPYYYMRQLFLNNMSWGAVAKLGKGPFEPQQFSFDKQMAQPGAKMEPYRMVSEDPYVYEVSCDEPYFYHRYDENGAVFKEGDFLDFTVKWWPFVMLARGEAGYFAQTDYSYIPLTMEGTFNGKKIVNGIGQIDRIYFPTDFDFGAYDPKTSSSGYLVYCACDGVRKDGRKELFLAHLMNENGKGMVIYWLEGEEPEIYRDAYIDANWQRLPYVDDAHEAYHFKECTWRFGNKSAHLINKWGSRRFTSDPKNAKPGYANGFGDFYVGDEPYSHEIVQTYCETMMATKEILEKYGYTIVE